jgi:hypothetical protein
MSLNFHAILSNHTKQKGKVKNKKQAKAGPISGLEQRLFFNSPADWFCFVNF